MANDSWKDGILLKVRPIFEIPALDDAYYSRADRKYRRVLPLLRVKHILGCWTREEKLRFGERDLFHPRTLGVCYLVSATSQCNPIQTLTDP